MCSSCRSVLAGLTRAMAKRAAATLRSAGRLPVHPRWANRAALCEQCPLRVLSAGKSYCGQPLLRQPHRRDWQDGCGCPTHLKAQDPTEHCALNPRNRPRRAEGICDCKWCQV